MLRDFDELVATETSRSRTTTEKRNR